MKTDDRKERTVVYTILGCTARDGAAMEKRVQETFGEQLEQCFGIATAGRGEEPGILGMERWSLRTEINDRMLAGGGEVKLTRIDGRSKWDWTIAIMVKDGGFLRSEKGLDAVINIGQVECFEAEVSIPPVGDEMVSWEEWLGSTLSWCGYVEAEFGDKTAFGVEPDTDEGSDNGDEGN